MFSPVPHHCTESSSRGFTKLRQTLLGTAAAVAVVLLVSPTHAAPTLDQALEAAKKASDDTAALRVALDTVWVLVAGVLVFFMNLGFGMVESGLNRAKNCVNIIAKNFVVFAVATLAFLIVGWGLMFGDGNGFMGLKGRGCDHP